MASSRSDAAVVQAEAEAALAAELTALGVAQFSELESGHGYWLGRQAVSAAQVVAAFAERHGWPPRQFLILRGCLLLLGPLAGGGAMSTGDRGPDRGWTGMLS